MLNSTLQPDPNEGQDVLGLYFKADTLIRRGEWTRARLLLEDGLKKYPESRHLHSSLAEIFWYLSRGTDQELLILAAREAIKSSEIGLAFHKDEDSWLLAQTLALTSGKEKLTALFTEMLAAVPSYSTTLHYAEGLAILRDPLAEEFFIKAIDLQPEGAIDATAELAEWLIDQDRNGDALDLLPSDIDSEYLHFLRGVAFDRLGLNSAAKEEYEKYTDYSHSFPAPARFRIKGSSAQVKTNLHFQDDLQFTSAPVGASTVTLEQLKVAFSALIWGEAEAESVGSKRAVGWIVRTRALRGTVKNSDGAACPKVENGTVLSSLPEMYAAVICQTSQFSGLDRASCRGWCSDPTFNRCSKNATSDGVAADVYNGYAPDPVSKHCPGGAAASFTDYCATASRCIGGTRSYKLAGPLFNYGTSGSCPARCTPTQNGKVCSNEGSDNCFYSNSSCGSGANYKTYNASLSSNGQYTTPSFQLTANGTLTAHLEGPEKSDFDLYLESTTGNIGPWQRVASSTRSSSFEDISSSGVSGKWYRWTVISLNGSGSLSLCTKKP
jgi:tetratricopeptide (TPR) repeat protein